MKTLAVSLILVTLLCNAGCARVATNVSGSTTLEAVKVAALGGEDILSLRIAELKRDPEANAKRIRIDSKILAVLQEFNKQIAPLSISDLSQIRTLRDVAIQSVRDLLNDDTIKTDPEYKPLIDAGVKLLQDILSRFDRVAA